MKLLAVDSFSLWDFQTWEFIIVISSILIILLLANLLINVIKPLKKALIPGSVLGGFILLGVISIIKLISKNDGVDGSNLDNFLLSIYNTLEIIAFQCLGIGFAASALKQKDKNKDESKSARKDIFNASVVTISGYTIQAVLGVIIGIVLYFILGSYPASGLLIPMGFGQGPSQALNWGTIYSTYNSIVGDPNFSEFGAFTNGGSFGLSIAALGFVAASIGGIIYLNIERRKGNIKMTRVIQEHSQQTNIEKYETENEIEDTGIVDKFSVQVGLVLLAYLASYLIILGISKLCDLSGVNLLTGTVKPLFWGFNFIIATLTATILKMILNKSKKKKIVKKEYINNYSMDRISGFSFDLMVVAAIGAINLDAFSNPSFIVPLIVMGVLATVVTYFYTKFMCDYLYKDYKEEMFLAMFGMLTGTASTGVILLREIDPNFKTRAQANLIYQPIISVALGAPLLLSLGSAAKTWTGLIIWGVMYVLMLVILFIVSKRDVIISKIKAKKTK